MASCLDKSGLDITKVKKVLIHQANEKMDEARNYSSFLKYTNKALLNI